jgi:hypothetical protein
MVELYLHFAICLHDSAQEEVYLLQVRLHNEKVAQQRLVSRFCIVHFRLLFSPPSPSSRCSEP